MSISRRQYDRFMTAAGYVRKTNSLRSEPDDSKAQRGEHFGCGKTVGRIRQAVYRGFKRVDQHFKLTVTASNIVRMARLPTAVPQQMGTWATKAHGKWRAVSPTG